uniref:Proteasome endopeptidase complex n=1 Tax=Brassica oleracea var. oleracea TaxID=109376 RepID=A0A0D3BM11_BRAOL
MFREPLSQIHTSYFNTGVPEIKDLTTSVMSNALIRMLKEVGSLCGLQDDIYCFKGTVLRKMRLDEAEGDEKELAHQEYSDPSNGEAERENGNKFFKKQEYHNAMIYHTEDIKRNPKDPRSRISQLRDSFLPIQVSNPTAMDLNLDAPHSMGTTIIGVTYNGGVVLGADSRTSTGMYVANRASDKITQLTDNVYVCRSGSAADSQVVSDYVRYFLHQHTIQLGQPATVKVSANLIRMLAYNNKLFNSLKNDYLLMEVLKVPVLNATVYHELNKNNMLQTGLIVGGWDKYEGGKIYGIPLGGTVVEQPFAIGGSGSSYLYGFFDQAWKENMTKEEAEQLVVKAVSLAIARDGASGGVVRTVIINSEGVTRNFYPGDKLQLWHEELEPQNSLLDILNAAGPEPMAM